MGKESDKKAESRKPAITGYGLPRSTSILDAYDTGESRYTPRPIPTMDEILELTSDAGTVRVTGDGLLGRYDPRITQTPDGSEDMEPLRSEMMDTLMNEGQGYDSARASDTVDRYIGIRREIGRRNSWVDSLIENSENTFDFGF